MHASKGSVALAQAVAALPRLQLSAERVQALESELGASKWIDDFPQQYFAPLLARVQQGVTPHI